MTLLFPETSPSDPQPANNPTVSRPVMGPKDRLGLFRWGRPRGVADQRTYAPGLYGGGATSADAFFVTRIDNAD